MSNIRQKSLAIVCCLLFLGMSFSAVAVKVHQNVPASGPATALVEVCCHYYSLGEVLSVTRTISKEQWNRLSAAMKNSTDNEVAGELQRMRLIPPQLSQARVRTVLKGASNHLPQTTYRKMIDTVANDKIVKRNLFCKITGEADHYNMLDLKALLIPAASIPPILVCLGLELIFSQFQWYQRISTELEWYYGHPFTIGPFFYLALALLWIDEAALGIADTIELNTPHKLALYQTIELYQEFQEDPLSAYINVSGLGGSWTIQSHCITLDTTGFSGIIITQNNTGKTFLRGSCIYLRATNTYPYFFP